MLERPFGDSGFTVSVLGFGAGHIGEPDQDDGESASVLWAALDAGVTFFDTARGYGLSEERIGRHLAPHRDEIVLSTKVGYGIPGTTDWSLQAVTAGVDRALDTLRTDRIDVVFLHSCSLEVLQRGGVIEGLQAAQLAGKVRVIGYSGENQALEWAVRSGHFGAIQTSVNIADQWSLQHVLVDAESRGLGVVAKRPLANAAWRFTSPPFGDYAELYWGRLRRLGVQPQGNEWLDTALRFAAYSRGVSTAIVGTGSVPHLQAAAAAVDNGPLDEAEYACWRDAFAPYVDEWSGSV